MSWTFSSCRSFRSIAFSSMREEPSASIGFSRKSKAPALIASTAFGMLPCPVMTITSASGCELLEPAQQLDAVHVGQHHVGDDRVGPPGPEDLLAARADERRPHLVARVLEQDLQPLGHRRLVVDGEHALLAFQSHGVFGMHDCRHRDAVRDTR